ncbi:hypothetical protein ACINK0_11345 [Deinococcus sp. VB343]|uniref:hypothetical protein n=1 Tax=Deinococcus sp. VB343 TaxID=3385567 RepID=UPI0039C9058A
MTQPPELDEATKAHIRAEERERAAVRDELRQERSQQRRNAWGINKLTPWLILLVVVLFAAMWAIFGPPTYWFGRSPYGF